MPIDFTFKASGGSGNYTWTDTQVFAVDEINITYQSGNQISRNFVSDTETLGQDPPGSTHGSTAVFFDAPGLSLLNKQHPNWGPVVSASVIWTFTLGVQVTDNKTGQVADCPMVDWSAVLTWTTTGKKRKISGSDSVETPPMR